MSEVRISAVRTAVQQMINNGLTGFVDRAGRNWTPEAYVSMDMRTTMHNTYVRSAFNRNEDYGNDLVYPGIKATSRPLCYPWQGKVLSTANRSGYVTDLNDSVLQIYPISSTTYGEPAGIWGINCGHSCNVFIPSLSIIRGEVPDKEENDKRYAESQQQRALERQVRYAKRDAAAAKATNDREAFDAAALKVKQKQADLNSFLEQTGRAPSVARTSVVEYNRSVASSVTQSANRQAATKASTGALNLTIDEYTPCLRDNKTGEILATTVSKVTDKTALKAYNETSGWYIDWSKTPKDVDVYKLALKGDDAVQGLIGLRNDKESQAAYIHWAVANPLSQASVVGAENKQYNGIGGHLFAIAAEKSVDMGYDGFITGYAANASLEKYYIQEFGGFHIGARHPYQFAIDERTARTILAKYNYEWG